MIFESSIGIKGVFIDVGKRVKSPLIRTIRFDPKSGTGSLSHETNFFPDHAIPSRPVTPENGVLGFSVVAVLLAVEVARDELHLIGPHPPSPQCMGPAAIYM